MKPIEQQRAEFETWFGPLHAEGMLHRNSRVDNYVYLFTSGAWLAWQEQERRHAVEFPEWGVKTVDTADQDEAE
jgi:hypothetical protein